MACKKCNQEEGYKDERQYRGCDDRYFSIIDILITGKLNIEVDIKPKGTIKHKGIYNK